MRPCSALEKELAVLIQDGPIQARIDSHNKVLYARHADRRTATFQEALQIGTGRARSSRALLGVALGCSGAAVFGVAAQGGHASL